MPPNVREEVIKIVRYYEEHMEMQIDQIHLLIEQNKKLKHQLEKKKDEQFEGLNSNDKENNPQGSINPKILK